jgi:hypothetical protein
MAMALASCRSAKAERGIMNCLEAKSCTEPAGKQLTPWSTAHEKVFATGIERILNVELCSIVVSSGQSLTYVSTETIKLSNPACRRSLVRSQGVLEATALLKQKRVQAIIEFRRLEAYSTARGPMVGALVSYSYAVDKESGEPLRDSFSQYLFIDEKGGLVIRWVAKVAS